MRLEKEILNWLISILISILISWSLLTLKLFQTVGKKLIPNGNQILLLNTWCIKIKTFCSKNFSISKEHLFTICVEIKGRLAILIWYH